MSAELHLVPYVLETSDGRRRIAAELGRLAVPENRHRAGSGTIELAFIRLRSSGADPRPPLIYLAGGPGSSGISSGRSPRLDFYLSLSDVCDVILLDQRGVGMSNPRLDAIERWDLPFDRPISREQFLDVAREKSRRVKVFWEERGVDLTGYTTDENADDVNDLRRALGADAMCLYGASYGSHLALTTIRRHEEYIARAVIPMVEGPDHTNKLPGNIQRLLEQISELVRVDAQLGAVIPDLLDLVGTVLHRLEREPVTVDVTHPLTGSSEPIALGKFDLQKETSDRMGSLDFIRRLPSIYLAMSRGDFTWLAQASADTRTDWFGNAMAWHMDCASGSTPERWAQIQREAQETLLGDAINLPFPEMCDAWGNPDAGEEFRSPISSDTKVLFMAGTLDGRTPVSNAEEIAGGFPNSQLLVIDNASHGPEVLQPEEVRRAIRDFLLGNPVPLRQTGIPFAFEPPA